jgi:hypothetical protein
MRGHVLDPALRKHSRDESPTPLVILGALAMMGGVTAFLTWPRSRAYSSKRQALVIYLRDHLSGSDTALRIVQRLGSTHQGTEDGVLFRRLSEEFEQERSAVRALLTQLGASGRSIKRATGVASGIVLSMTAGGEAGDLSLLRTLEALSIGVQGKRCMWRALQNLATAPATARGLDFVELEAQAIRQWEAIETRRRALAMQTFSMASAE